jgi:hypothetical protein
MLTPGAGSSSGQPNAKVVEVRAAAPGTSIACRRGMPVAQSSRVEAKDIDIFAGSLHVSKLVEDVIGAAAGAEPKLDEHLRLCVDTLNAAVIDAVRASDDAQTLRRLRQMSFLLDETRHATWMLYDRGLVTAALFDEVMITTAACRRKVDSYYAAARRTAYRRLAGLER